MHMDQTPKFAIRPDETGLDYRASSSQLKAAYAWVKSNRFQTYWAGIRDEAKAAAAAKRATEKSGIPFKVSEQYSVFL